jgi:hypothetical protein
LDLCFALPLLLCCLPLMNSFLMVKVLAQVLLLPPLLLVATLLLA